MLSRIVRIPIVNNECIYFVHPKMKQNARRFLNSMAVGIKGEGRCFLQQTTGLKSIARLTFYERDAKEMRQSSGPFGTVGARRRQRPAVMRVTAQALGRHHRSHRGYRLERARRP